VLTLIRDVSLQEAMEATKMKIAHFETEKESIEREARGIGIKTKSTAKKARILLDRRKVIFSSFFSSLFFFFVRGKL
jgi:hypothetical protein